MHTKVEIWTNQPSLILTGQKPPLNKTPVFTKTTNMGIWFFGTSNQIFIKGFSTETKFFKK